MARRRESFSCDFNCDCSALRDSRRSAREQIFDAALTDGDRVPLIVADVREPGLDDAAGRDSAVELDPRFDNLAVFDQRGPGLPDPAFDQPLRQWDNPRR